MRTYVCAFNPRLVYALRNARPVSTRLPRDNDEGDEEVDVGAMYIRERRGRVD